MKLKLTFVYLIYIITNSLFIVKYTSRIDDFNAYLITFFYVIFVSIFSLTYIRLDLKNYYKPLFLITSIIFFVFTIYLNIKVDGTTLNVDRWSAMEVGIEALLKGEYPYSAIDHLNGRTSNLPTLIFIGIPFYLIGDVGFLQSFSFLLFLTTQPLTTIIRVLFLKKQSTHEWWELNKTTNTILMFFLKF